ncbi:glycosyltransferase family 4 protein [Sphingomonas sp. MMS24-J45]|uniref:glycosyltransferase family 4 protein n=1 Tax=Sphingomonas sp. MMS24-J45 TaxID=3238806 RepID=UPI00384D93B6
MKLLLVGYLHSEGGVKNHTLWLARGLAARGHTVTVATPGPIGTEPYDLPQEDSVRIVNVETIGQVVRGYPTGTPEAFDCAVVVGTGWKSMLGPLLNRRIKKRVFFEVMSGARNGKIDPRMLVHYGYDALVGQGRPVEALFKKSFGWTGPSITIPALSDPLELVADLTLLPKTARAPGSLKACYFGRLAPHKGLGWLIERWDIVGQDIATLDIWGSGPQDAELRAMIAERGLDGRIRLCGRFPGGADYAALLHTYDLEILPTYGAEGAPLVLLEAMACGVPFVANGVGGIPDYGNMDCRITSGNLDEFLPALRSLANALYADEIDHARLQRHYLEHFSYKALCDRWEAFLLDLVGETRA